MVGRDDVNFSNLNDPMILTKLQLGVTSNSKLQLLLVTIQNEFSTSDVLHLSSLFLGRGISSLHRDGW